jgi:hypothetical protein
VFTEDGIGGPAAFDVTRITAPLVRGAGSVTGFMDFYPRLSPPQMEAALMRLCADNPKKELVSILHTYVPRRVCELLLRTVPVRCDIAAGQLRKEERRRLVELLKAMPLTIVQHGAIDKATVTGGGVSGKEIDFKTMQSRLCRGLFFAGEVIDVDGPCGGYNLQIAFSTGALAGRSAAAYVNTLSKPRA